MTTETWSAWATPLAWTIGTLAAAWLISQLLGAVFLARVRRWLAGRVAFVVGAVSVRLALAALARQSVDAYGALISPARPVSSLTRNVAWTLVAPVDP